VSLTDTKIRTAKPDNKPQKLTDSNGLYLEIRPSGKKLWRYRYRIDGKENLFALGGYPEITLADARAERDRARLLVKEGVHPSHNRKLQEAAKRADRANTFHEVAAEWLEQNRQRWSSGYATQVENNLGRHVFVRIGERPIREINSAELLSLLRVIEKRGTPSVARLNQQLISAVFRYGIATLRADSDPTYALRGAITAPKVQHYRPVPLEEIPILIEKTKNYGGRIETIFAIRLLLLTFLRGGELRQGQWSEIDFEKRLWRIPADRMKNRVNHTIPLSQQSVALLEELKEITGHQRWLFPGYGRDRCISSHTITKALRYMGYEDFSAHGFRSTASTLLNEMGYRPDVIERQLSHVDQNAVRASYNRAEYLPERKEMMQQWADYLDSLHDGNVVPIHQQS